MRVESPTKGQTTASEFLSLVHEQPQQSARLVRSTGWRITGPPVNVDEFWRMFDAVVAPDGSVDYTPILPPEATGPIPVASAGPAMYQAAVAVVALWGAAAAAGYQLGKDIGEALDGDDEDEPEGGDDDDGEGERQKLGAGPVRVELVPQKGRLRVQVIDASSEPQTLAADRTRVSFTEFLAMLRTARRATLRRLRTGSIRSIVSEPLSNEQFETTLDSVVQADGSIDPKALAGQTLPDGVAVQPARWPSPSGSSRVAHWSPSGWALPPESSSKRSETPPRTPSPVVTMVPLTGPMAPAMTRRTPAAGVTRARERAWPDSSAQGPRPQSRMRFAPSNSVASTPSTRRRPTGVLGTERSPEHPSHGSHAESCQRVCPLRHVSADTCPGVHQSLHESRDDYGAVESERARRHRTSWPNNNLPRGFV